jgi:hypothetical protein
MLSMAKISLLQARSRSYVLEAILDLNILKVAGEWFVVIVEALASRTLGIIVRHGYAITWLYGFARTFMREKFNA